MLNMRIILLIIIVANLLSISHSFTHDQENQKVQVKYSDLIMSVDLILGNSKKDGDSFSWPISVAVDESRRIYVADYRESRIAVFSETGAYLKTIGRDKNDFIRLNNPISIFIDSEDTIYIADSSRKGPRISSVTKEREAVQSFSPEYPPMRIIGSGDSIFCGQKVSDYNVFRYSKKGEILSKIDGVAGKEDIKTRAVFTVDSHGRIYLARTFIPVVVKISPDGLPLAEYHYDPQIENRRDAIEKTVSSRGGTFTIEGSENPILLDLAVDKAGYMYLLIARDHNQPGVCSLWRVDPAFQNVEKANLPFRCGKMYIDRFDDFYFIGWSAFPYVFRCRAERLGGAGFFPLDKRSNSR